MIAPPAAPDPFDALLTPDRERALATAIRAGRRARLLAQRHLTVRLRRELSLTVNARVAAGAVVAALLPHLPLAPDALPAVVDPLLPRTLDQDARARVLAGLAVCLDQEALTAGDAARAAFVTANGRLVVALARRYQHRGLPLDDLVQEGTVGLLRAVDLFDPTRGYKFSTYAVWWIKQALRRALAQQVPLAHVPDNVQMERARLARQAHALHAALGTRPPLPNWPPRRVSPWGAWTPSARPCPRRSPLTSWGATTRPALWATSSPTPLPPVPTTRPPRGSSPPPCAPPSPPPWTPVPAPSSSRATASMGSLRAPSRRSATSSASPASACARSRPKR